MKRFIRRLMWRLFGISEPRVVYLKETVWTEREAKDLKVFLNSDLGKNLMDALQVDVACAQSWAVSPDQLDMQFKAGFAHGKQRLISRIQELALIDDTKDNELRFEEEEIDRMINAMATGKERDLVFGDK